MNNAIRLKKRLEEGRLRIMNEDKKCLFPGCNESAIGSHVLQEHGILKEIVDSTNHFYAIGHVPVFHMTEEKVFTIKKIGINAGYKFRGFCNKHDTEIFLPIEKHPIDLTDGRNQCLFAYRTVCLELSKQQTYLEINKDVLKAMYEVEPNKVHAIILQPAEYAIKDMEFYKKEIEDFIFNGKLNSFNLDLIVLPEKKICFSAAMSIEDRANKLTSDVDEYGRPNENPLPISILNYFPYRGHSYLLAAHHKRFFCNWTKSLAPKLVKTKDQDKIISDILTYRLEFWAMAPMFYERLSKDKTNKFLAEAHAYSGHFNIDINTEFNLFT